MGETPRELYERVEAAAAASGGRLPFGEMADWDVFPFEQEGLRVRALQPPVPVEPPRYGEGGLPCGCTGSTPRSDLDALVWQDEHWQIAVPPPSGSPLVLQLRPHQHVDVPGLPDDLAAELGLLTVRLCAAIESLPHVARAHVSRWGDGGAHAHVWFFARPYGFDQLRGTMLAVWDDILPPVPLASRDEDVAHVVQRLIQTYGGSSVSQHVHGVPQAVVPGGDTG